MAVQELRRLRHVRDNDEYYQSATAASAAEHPLVGLVDHVSIMPLTGAAIPSESDIETERQRQAAAWAARKVGPFMEEKLNIRVLYYGMAHPEKMPLAMVRREQTQFFQSGGLAKLAQPQTHPTACTPVQGPRESATVGTPEHFVENTIAMQSQRGTVVDSSHQRARRRTTGSRSFDAAVLGGTVGSRLQPLATIVHGCHCDGYPGLCGSMGERTTARANCRNRIPCGHNSKSMRRSVGMLHGFGL
jgi:Formiminotransferase domain, N-terminal subdomain